MIASNDDKIEIAVNQLPNDVITGKMQLHHKVVYYNKY